MKYILFLIPLIFAACLNSDSSPILKEFNSLSPETKNFFNANAKVQCKCLREHKSELAQMLENTKKLRSILQNGKNELLNSDVQVQLNREIYPVLARYSNCNASAPQPKPEMLKIIEKDLKKLGSKKYEGLKSDNIFSELGKALIAKHCTDLVALRNQLDELSMLISPSKTQK